MAHFYGMLQGARGEATRCGTKGSGLQVNACSWQGRIDVYLRHDESTGKDHYAIKMDTHGHSQGWCGYIADGVLGEQPEMPTLLPVPTIESFNDEALAAEVRRRFNFDLVLRQPQPLAQVDIPDELLHSGR